MMKDVGSKTIAIKVRLGVKLGLDGIDAVYIKIPSEPWIELKGVKAKNTGEIGKLVKEYFTNKS